MGGNKPSACEWELRCECKKSERQQQSNYQRYLHVETCQFAWCKYIVGHTFIEHIKRNQHAHQTQRIYVETNRIASNSGEVCKKWQRKKRPGWPAHNRSLNPGSLMGFRTGKRIPNNTNGMRTHGHLMGYGSRITVSRNIFVDLINTQPWIVNCETGVQNNSINALAFWARQTIIAQIFCRKKLLGSWSRSSSLFRFFQFLQNSFELIGVSVLFEAFLIILMILFTIIHSLYFVCGSVTYGKHGKISITITMCDEYLMEPRAIKRRKKRRNYQFQNG